MLRPQAKLYGLIWRRAIASQMESAEFQQIQAELQSPCELLLLRSTGSSLTFPGYQAAWADQSGSSSSSSSEGSVSESVREDDPESVRQEDGSGSVTDEVTDKVTSGSGTVSEVLGRLVEGQQVPLRQVRL